MIKYTLRKPDGSLFISIESDTVENDNCIRLSTLFRDAVEELVINSPNQIRIDKFLRVVRPYKLELTDVTILDSTSDVNERYVGIGKRAVDWYREASLFDGSNHPKHKSLTKIPEVKWYLLLFCKKVNINFTSE